MWNNGTSEPTYTTIEEPSRSMSYFGRLNYIFNDRYYLTFTLRSDGTNVFAPGNKWGIFPAGSLAWRISDEKSWLQISTQQSCNRLSIWRAVSLES